MPRMRSLRTVSPGLLDGLIACVFFLVGQLDAWLGLADGGAAGTIHIHRPLNAALLALFALPLVLRRRAPFAGLCLMFTAALLQIYFVQPVALFFGGLVPVALMTYAVAAYPERKRLDLAGLALALAGVNAVAHGVPSLRTWNEALFDGLVLITAWTVGRIVGGRGRRVSELAGRAERLEREQEQQARLAVAEERARLARELHDIVAHSVSVIAVQAQAAETFVANDPERVAQSLRTIQSTSRQTLVELRRLLGLLREPGEPTLTPQPGLGLLKQLVQDVRAAGLDVDVAVEGEQRELAPGVDLSAYRIVQEALTNTLKHAPAAHADVQIRYKREQIEVEIVDDGTAAVSPNGTGQGLIGMRERVALYGGTLEAGPQPGGGFRIRGVLPTEGPQ